MTNEAFCEFIGTIYQFILSYTWAIGIVGFGIGLSVYLGRRMDTYQSRLNTLTLPPELYSKESLVGWRNTMFSTWRLGLGSLLPSFMVFAVCHYLPKIYLAEDLVEFSNINFNLIQAFWFLQAIVFLMLLSVKFHALWDCFIAESIARKAGL